MSRETAEVVEDIEDIMMSFEDVLIAMNHYRREAVDVCAEHFEMSAEDEQELVDTITAQYNVDITQKDRTLMVSLPLNDQPHTAAD
jgi:division protein CdvB (Snf7/Vps24/ESCRT-III family)